MKSPVSWCFSVHLKVRVLEEELRLARADPWLEIAQGVGLNRWDFTKNGGFMTAKAGELTRPGND